MDSEHITRATSTTDGGGVHAIPCQRPAQVIVDGLPDCEWQAGHQKRNHGCDLETIGWLNATTIEVSCEEEPADWPTEEFEEMCGIITGNKLCPESLQKATREELVGQATSSKRSFGRAVWARQESDSLWERC